MNTKLFTFVCFALLVYAGNTLALEKSVPFHPGEKMTFRVRWAFIDAGEATLEFLPYSEYEGTPACHFLFTARTTEFVDLFYKVRDRIESFTDRKITKSLYYHKKHEGNSVKEATVTFDWKNNTVNYFDGGAQRDPLSVRPGTFDPLSVFYAFRLYLGEKGNDSDLYVTDGKKCITGSAKIIKKEIINVSGNQYSTLLVEPEMENLGGVFEKSKNARLKIWVTDDELRLPVRIKSKVAVGSFVADLISYNYKSETNEEN